MAKQENEKSQDISAEKIADEVAEKVRQSVLDFVTSMRNGSSNGQGIMTIDELERNWDVLDAKTQKTYAGFIGDELSRIDEKPLIESKKPNSPKER